jgi:hypothetical protein
VLGDRACTNTGRPGRPGLALLSGMPTPGTGWSGPAAIDRPASDRRRGKPGSKIHLFTDRDALPPQPFNITGSMTHEDFSPQPLIRGVCPSPPGANHAAGDGRDPR